jgi:hypothetical protein
LLDISSPDHGRASEPPARFAERRRSLHYVGHDETWMVAMKAVAGPVAMAFARPTLWT